MDSNSAARGTRGSALVEVIIAMTIFTLVMLSSMAMVESGRRFSNSTLEITAIEEYAQQMLFKIEHELANATGFEPAATLQQPLSATNAIGLAVDSSLGFPPRGSLVLERGTAREERIGYTVLEPDFVTFSELARGAQCTTGQDHPFQAEVLWSGLAEPIALQANPPLDTYDGIALEQGAGIYFRGDGTGFSYRIPIDPSGGNNVLNGEDLFWGANVPGVGPTLQGWLALTYLPKDAFEEAGARFDLNKDGDFDDVFDIGQIRRASWDTSDPTRAEDLGLGPSNIVQERCQWGSDLDGDGFQDPLFLWNKDTNELHVRLFLIGTSRELPVVRRIESLLFLRNEPEMQ